jgi:hypothetical protein
MIAAVEAIHLQKVFKKYVSENILEEDENDFNEIEDYRQSRYVDCLI